MAIEITSNTEIAAGQTVSIVDPPAGSGDNNTHNGGRTAYLYLGAVGQPPVFSNHGTIELLLRLRSANE